MMPRHNSQLTPWDTPEWRRKNRSVNQFLLSRFPELSDLYEREIVQDDWEDEGPMVVYGFIFRPFLLQALRQELEGSPLLERIYKFINELAHHPDPHYSETATVAIREFLEDEPDLLSRAQHHVDLDLA